jgi:hypothetical protein
MIETFLFQWQICDGDQDVKALKYWTAVKYFDYNGNFIIAT